MSNENWQVKEQLVDKDIVIKNLPGGTEKDHKNNSQDSQFHS
jgi:hypothetical protein